MFCLLRAIKLLGIKFGLDTLKRKQTDRFSIDTINFNRASLEVSLWVKKIFVLEIFFHASIYTIHAIIS